MGAAEVADFDNSGERDIYQVTISLGNEATFLVQGTGTGEFVHRTSDDTGVEVSLWHICY